VYAAGSAFVESGNHPGLVRNESTTTAAIVHVTYVVPEGIPGINAVPLIGEQFVADNPLAFQ